MKRLIAYTDGCSKGNPGPAAIGVVIYVDDENMPAVEIGEQAGILTNNQAEYCALIRALEYARKQQATSVEIRADSELVVKQMKGEYRVKNVGLKRLYLQARRYAGLIEDFKIQYVPREQNRIADMLANKALK